MQMNEINYKQVAFKSKLIKMVQITCNNKIDFSKKKL